MKAYRFGAPDNIYEQKQTRCFKRLDSSMTYQAFVQRRDPMLYVNILDSLRTGPYLY